MHQDHDETPAELRARAARVRSHAWDFVGSTMARMLRKFADELDAKASAIAPDRVVAGRPGAGQRCARRPDAV